MADHSDVVLKGGRVLDASGERAADVVIGPDGFIVAVGTGLTADRVLDATGCVVTPGLVDLFATLGEPGNEEHETIESATRAAVAGGYTAVVAAPDPHHPLDSAAGLRDLAALARGALCEVAAVAALTVGAAGTQLAPMSELADLGVRLFGDPGAGAQDPALLRRALQYAGDLGVVIAQPAVASALAGAGCMHEGEWSSRLGLAGVPSEAEESAVMQLVALARSVGTAVHVRGVSTAASLAMVTAARRGGIRITADVAPAHALLTDAVLAGVVPAYDGWTPNGALRADEPDPDRAYDPQFCFEPPLRPEADRAAVAAALATGDLDVLISGHTPVAAMAKELPIDSAEPGAIGLDVALGLALGPLGLPLATALALLSWRPAALAGLGASQGGLVEAGRPANLLVLDPETTWTYDPGASHSRSRNTPWGGLVLRGRARHTVASGEVVVLDGEVTR